MTTAAHLKCQLKTKWKSSFIFYAWKWVLLLSQTKSRFTQDLFISKKRWITSFSIEYGFHAEYKRQTGNQVNIWRYLNMSFISMPEISDIFGLLNDIFITQDDNCNDVLRILFIVSF